MYLESVNFKTKNINYDNIDINVMTYHIINYLKKSGSIEEEDILTIYCPCKHNDKTLKTKNYIFKYYTNKFKEAADKDNEKSRNYYDNEVLGHLLFYDRVDRDYFFN